MDDSNGTSAFGGEVGNTELGTMKSLWVRQMGQVLLAFLRELLSLMRSKRLLGEVCLAEARQSEIHSGKKYACQQVVNKLNSRKAQHMTR